MRGKSSGKSPQMAILSVSPSRNSVLSTYILRKLPLTYLIAVKMKMDGFLICQEMLRASFSTEALINDCKCPHISDSVKKSLSYNATKFSSRNTREVKNFDFSAV